MEKSVVDLNELLVRENARTEWKENVVDINKVLKTICAFSNDFNNLGGGFIICGAKEVKDENGFVKVELTGLDSDRYNELSNRIPKLCVERIKPEVYPQIEEISIADNPSKKILVIIVRATDKAHTFRDDKEQTRHYVRIDSHTIEARNGLYTDLMLRKGAIETWDKRPFANSSPDDISLINLRDFFKKAKISFRDRDIQDYISDEVQISSLTPPLAKREPLTRNLLMRNFALLAFSEKPMRFFDGAYVIFSIYSGTDRSTPQGERQILDGSIIQQAERLIQLLDTETSTVFDKTSDTPNLLKYPLIALKEAAINALVHRDYEINQQIRVTVFDDRIEILSPGKLPRQIDPEKFKTGKATAFWRNTALSDLFNRLQFAQGEGQGVPTILRSMHEMGNPAPIFEFGEDNVLCVLPAHPRHKHFKAIREAEHQIILRNFEYALKIIETILGDDPHNYRAIELYCEVCNRLDLFWKVFEFANKHIDELTRIPATALLSMAESLSFILNNKDVENLSKVMLHYAANSQLEEKQIVSVARMLKKFGWLQDTELFIKESFERYPYLKESPLLFQLRARVSMDLAKKCEESYYDGQMTSSRREQALRRFGEYLKQAEDDLKQAISKSPQSEMEWLNKDWQFLKEMQSHINKKAETYKYHLSNIPTNTTIEELRNYLLQFEQIGEIESISELNPIYLNDHVSHTAIYLKSQPDLYSITQQFKRKSLNGSVLKLRPYGKIS